VDMTDIKWGTKRMCVECEAPFYDMRRTPIACPKCGVVHKPVVLLKADGRPPRKNRARPPAPLQAQVTPGPAEAEADDLLPASADAEDVDDVDEADDADKDSEPVEENEGDAVLEPSEPGR
jgi:uncharacterized protein (TIGR02300 family)